MTRLIARLSLPVVGLLMVFGCSLPDTFDSARITIQIPTTVRATLTLSMLSPSAGNVPKMSTAVPTLVPSTTATPQATQNVLTVSGFTATPYVEPAGCQRPPDEYSRVIVNGAKLNYRTLWMLQHAQKLYGGAIDFSNKAITQGSYNPGGVAASFGTHDGGGAVDLSVIKPGTGLALRGDFPAAIHALRVAGFAAWVREPNELYAGSPLHIHAIAIGDAELSPAARDQLTGPSGYFLGYDGLPQKNNIPVPDRYGGPILCQWMLDMGYTLRPGAALTPEAHPANNLAVPQSKAPVTQPAQWQPINLERRKLPHCVDSERAQIAERPLP